MITFSDYYVPQAKDQQIIAVTQAQLKQEDHWIDLTLPDYINVKQSETIRFRLNYSFTNNTTPSLIMQANHYFLEIYLNGEKLYQVEPRNSSLGNYFTNVPLPVETQDDYLEMRISVPEEGLHRIQLPELYIADELVYLKDSVKYDIISFFLNSLILIVGFGMIVIAFMNRTKSANWLKLIQQGSAILNLAIYFMCETYIVVYLISYSKFIYYLDMLSFSLLAPTLLLFFSWGFDNKYKKILFLLSWLGLSNSIIQLCLSVLGVIELRITLKYTHLVQILSVLAVAYCLIGSIYHKRIRLFFSSISFIIVGGLIDILLFTLEMNYYNVFFLKIGILIYVSIEGYVYVIKVVNQIKEKTREEYYKHLAFHDVLTNCYSRLAFEIDKGEWKGEQIQTIFSFDINDLKKTNDLYGHDQGDQLIKAFSTIFIKIFEEYGKCYRIGGDEFIAMCPNLYDGCAQHLISMLDKQIEVFNQDLTLKTPISYAVGIYTTKATNGNLIQAINLSDEQMYQNKLNIKSQMVKQ